MRLFRPIFAALLLILSSLGWLRPAAAQNVYATVHGVVTDESGAVIGGAKVTALNSSTGITSQAVTDSKGYYVFAQLQTGGPYSIIVESPGFQSFKSSGLTLVSNDNREVSAKLTVGSSAQTVQVEAATVQVE